MSSNRPHVYSVPVTPLSSQDCTIMFQRKRAHYTLDEFCAWDEAGDTCTGDLGGPLVAETNGRSVLIGLSSYISTKASLDNYDYVGDFLNSFDVCRMNSMPVTIQGCIHEWEHI